MLNLGDIFQFLFQKPIGVHENGMAHLRENLCPIRLVKLGPFCANDSGICVLTSGRDIAGQRYFAEFLG
jgi:hypothetical protein